MERFQRTVIIPTVAVFLIVLSIVFVSFALSRNSAQRQADRAIAAYNLDTQSAIKDRLSIFEETLRAGLGLFAGSSSINKEQFQQFISTSAVLERYPGAQSVAYAKVVSPADKQQFIDSTKLDLAKPDYTIFPDSPKEFYTPVLFIEPQTESNKSIMGFDISSEPTRLKALVAARDTGNVTITETVQSVLDKSPAGRAFIMYAPQYKRGMPTRTVEERRAAIEGFMYSGFRVQRFIESVIPDQAEHPVGFKISVGDKKSELFKSGKFDEVSRKRHQTFTSTTEFGSMNLHFEYAYQRQALLPNETRRPVRILIAGIIAALLVAASVYLIFRGKANQLLLEQERGINEAKDNLLSLASHQLRTPATGVKQYLGMLLQGFAGTLTKQQKDLLKKAYAGNERQLKTINDVLYMARLGSGRIILSKSSFSVAQVIEDILRELKQEISARGHTVAFRVPRTKKVFYGDEHMIRMALENLITNAIKYTKDGGDIKIRIIFGADTLKVSVTDNGVGIDRVQQNRLFEQFERIDNDLSIAVGGSGIGLYVVRNIASLHGGHVEVLSELNEGSKFTLVLPVEKPPETS